MRALAEHAARTAGAIIRGSAVRSVRHKGEVDLVTEVDLACEHAIRELLLRDTPDIPVVGEELSERGALPATCWIVDPLDGTTNFVHGFPSYCVSVALQVDGRLEVGGVYDAVRDVLYSAQRGRGATVDGQRLRVSACRELDGALLASGFPYDRRERAAFYLAYFQAFMERAQGLRRAGAAALDLAWVAEGRLDGFWEFGLQPWDLAAGALLITEAGGVVTDLEDQTLALSGRRILASNGHIHRAMVRVIAHVTALRQDRMSGQPGSVA